jgi:hypothetical protein
MIWWWRPVIYYTISEAESYAMCKMNLRNKITIYYLPQHSAIAILYYDDARGLLHILTTLRLYYTAEYGEESRMRSMQILLLQVRQWKPKPPNLRGELAIIINNINNTITTSPLFAISLLIEARYLIIWILLVVAIITTLSLTRGSSTQRFLSIVVVPPSPNTQTTPRYRPYVRLHYNNDGGCIHGSPVSPLHQRLRVWGPLGFRRLLLGAAKLIIIHYYRSEEGQI